MGVPQFFHWLVTHFEYDILQNGYPGADRPEYLYLDFNCGIHPAAKKEGLSSLNEIYDSVCQYLEKIIKEVKPTKLIYIAIDGVVPMAKMKQQRIRRFKSIKDQREKDKIDRKFKCWKPSKFDFNMISPGTEFMKNLSHRLHQFVDTKLSNVNFILDDADNPCEGEHKIMEHLRNHVPNDAKVVIYGLDSDLIFLSLLHYRPNMCLFREKIIFGQRINNKNRTNNKNRMNNNRMNNNRMNNNNKTNNKMNNG